MKTSYPTSPNVQTCSEAHPTSYQQVQYQRPLLGGKAVRVRSWPLFAIECRVYWEWVELHLSCRYTPSWRETGTTFPFPFTLLHTCNITWVYLAKGSITFFVTNGQHDERYFGDIVLINWFTTYTEWGTTVAQWLGCCATYRKVAGSILAGVIGIFHWHNPSDSTMALGSTQSLTEMSTRSISWW